MRYDSFIVWSTGVKHLNEIMCMIRDHFEVLIIRRHSIEDLPRFIDDIYSCDSYPLAHLKAKTKYLLNTENICFLILVKNHHVNEQMVGSPPYRKPQCLYLQGIKNKIRNKFNPSFTEHVIHGTDYESQVDHILKVFKLNKKERYSRDLGYPYPWHLPIPQKLTKVMVKVDQLKCNILGKGHVSIFDTPHYEYVKGNKKEYEIYHKQHRGLSLMDDHFPERFDDMIKIYEWGDFEPIIIKDKVVLDGVHRLAIMADNYESIKAYHADIS